MVNNAPLRRLVFGQYVMEKPRKGDDRKRVGNGPIFHLAKAKQLVEKHGVIVSESATDDMSKRFVPAITEDDAKAIIVDHLASHHFWRSEICKFRNGMEIDCDGYKISWNLHGKCEDIVSGIPIYIKFGFRDNFPKGIIVSFHES